eukprot:787962-Rhodomonas_salina.1
MLLVVGCTEARPVPAAPLVLRPAPVHIPALRRQYGLLHCAVLITCRTTRVAPYGPSCYAGTGQRLPGA